MNLKEKNKAIGILKKVYHFSNTDYETDYGDIVGYKTGFLNDEQWNILKKSKLMPAEKAVPTSPSASASQPLKLLANAVKLWRHAEGEVYWKPGGEPSRNLID